MTASQAPQGRGIDSYIATVFSVTVPAAILNSRFDELLSSQGLDLDSAAKAGLELGQAYEKASRGFFDSFTGPYRGLIISMYEMSLRRVWQILIAFAGIGLIAVLAEKNLETCTEQTSDDFGIRERATTAE
ncbi:hypothetical protein CDEST_05916 [Colletotrichum destructivum]|uniref:Uncharacterized protein n=1 Tax=Colletotrichum destructivum TaxID=34406 RepID=A0AAX4IC28_9PEZI|nr:hypothetical protein CDEST_05916 [Colletotrichum destructivum]